MSLLYSLKAFWILFRLLVPMLLLLLLIAVFLMLLNIQSQILPHFPHPLVCSQICLQVRVTPEAGEVDN